MKYLLFYEDNFNGEKIQCSKSFDTKKEYEDFVQLHRF